MQQWTETAYIVPLAIPKTAREKRHPGGSTRDAKLRFQRPAPAGVRQKSPKTVEIYSLDARRVPLSIGSRKAQRGQVCHRHSASPALDGDMCVRSTQEPGGYRKSVYGIRTWRLPDPDDPDDPEDPKDPLFRSVPARPAGERDPVQSPEPPHPQRAATQRVPASGNSLQ